ncbi:MAG: protein jag [Pisciglobus halotolerans]|nr:protein jag [Pisciglobus halotolerans]
MDRYTAKASTVDEAIEKALKTLGVEKEEASIEVIEEGKKGFLGFGKKDAVVQAKKQPVEKSTEEVFKELEEEPEKTSIKTTDQTNDSAPVEQQAEENKEDAFLNDDQVISYIADYLENVATEMTGEASVTTEKKGKTVTFHIETKKTGMIIGKHGKVLNALQTLAQVLLHRHGKRKLSAVVNAGDYRERRKEILRKLAERTADKVSETNQPVFLEAMPAFERKIIHFYLSENKWVTTHSEGKEPHRYLVLEPAEV